MCSNVILGINIRHDTSCARTPHVRRQMMLSVIIACCASLTILFALSACKDIEPIFASIETEEKIESGNLPDIATGLGMARINDNYLLATGGAIFYRSVNSDVWDTLTLPDGLEGAIKIVEITKKSLAYAVLVRDYYTEPSSYALYKITPGNVATFSKIRESSEFIDIWGVEGQENIFAMLGTGRSKKYYSNYQVSDAEPQLITIKTGISGVTEDEQTYTEHSASIVGVAYNTQEPKFYIATEYGVFRYDQGIDPTTATQIDISGDKTSVGYVGGIYYSQLYNKLLVSTARLIDKGGFVRTSTDDGETWVRSAEQTSMFFTTFMDIDQTSFTGILVGTNYRPGLGRDQGYREFEDGDIGNMDVPSGNKYTSGKLDTSGTIGFYLDQNTFYVFTKSLGVWRGDYNDGRSVDWYLE